jgi:hypothetical protein
MVYWNKPRRNTRGLTDVHVLFLRAWVCLSPRRAVVELAGPGWQGVGYIGLKRRSTESRLTAGAHVHLCHLGGFEAVSRASLWVGRTAL